MKYDITNLTQHNRTKEQDEVGVSERDEKSRKEIVRLLIFETPPSIEEIEDRAKRLAHIAWLMGHKRVMIAGAPWLMPELKKQLQDRNLIPIYDFSIRENIKERDSGGNITNKLKFKHVCFIEA